MSVDANVARSLIGQAHAGQPKTSGDTLTVLLGVGILLALFQLFSAWFKRHYERKGTLLDWATVYRCVSGLISLVLMGTMVIIALWVRVKDWVNRKFLPAGTNMPHRQAAHQPGSPGDDDLTLIFWIGIGITLFLFFAAYMRKTEERREMLRNGAAVVQGVMGVTGLLILALMIGIGIFKLCELVSRYL